MSTRSAIAAVLSTVVVDADGDQLAVTGAEQAPGTWSPGVAWPVWMSSTWLTVCVVERTWRVCVVLPAGDAATWTGVAEALLDPVRDALEKVGHVQRAEPITLTSGDPGATSPGLAFTVTTTE